MRKRQGSSGVTIWDVARESNVSIATVSHVLNNGPRPVREETRKRVLEAMQRLNYHPNAMAQGLVRRRMNTIGLISGVFTTDEIIFNPFASALIQGIFSVASSSAYNIMLFTQQWKDTTHSSGPFRDRRTDGIIVIAPPTDSDMVTSLASLGLLLVVVSTPMEHLGVPSVDVDNVAGGRMAAEHLIGLGHKNIVHITGNANMESVSSRSHGFLQALASHNLTSSEPNVIAGAYDGSGVYDITCNLLRRANPPTAIFAGNDGIAIPVLEAARDMNVSVPEQLSVIGFDDIPAAAMLSPQLTTIRQPLSEIGMEATRMLIARIAGEDVPIETKYLAPTLILRSSTAPASR
jgi:DNA-binding LacI/PurR family transcriptional regulator